MSASGRQLDLVLKYRETERERVLFQREIDLILGVMRDTEKMYTILIVLNYW